MNEALMKLCADNGYLYADYDDAMLLPDVAQDVAATIDGLHPNAAGYAKMTAKSNFYEKQRKIRSAASRTAKQGHP
jgi:hypothetical protein